MRSFVNRLKQIFDSPKFFWFVLLFFVFESLWIALSATYPQAFDENFHFGIIQIYSHYWLPFLSSQPPHADAFGAVARDPSYLYHYLMSFPYRLITLVVHGQVGQVVLLRILNIGLFAAGLVLFRKILLRVKISRPLANLIIFLFALVPIVPQLAAQINYDNLLFPLVAWVILVTFNVIDELKAHKISVKSLVTLLTLCLLTSLVKYAFLPIFAGIVIFLIVASFWKYHYEVKELLSNVWQSWLKQSIRAKVVLLSLLVISMGMFIQRDVVNFIKYHDVAPDCSVVLSVNDCKAYNAWDFNYNQHQIITTAKASGNNVKFMNPISYAFQWVYWMWYRLFFAVNGPNSTFTSYPNYPPLPLPSAAALIIILGGIVAVIKWRRQIFRNNTYLALLFFVSLCYIVALFAQGYSVYQSTDILENMNGRYLLPILLMLIAVVAVAFSLEFRHSANRKMLLAVAVLVLFLQGGGFLTFISRSDNTWYLQNSAVEKVNSKAKSLTKPLLVKGRTTYNTSLWFFN